MINNKFNVFYVNYIMTDDSNNTILQFIKFVLLLHAKHIWNKNFLCIYQHINFIFKEIDDHLDKCEESISELLVDRNQLEAQRSELVGKIERLDEILRKLYATRPVIILFFIS